jgi:hypothetical protein
VLDEIYQIDDLVPAKEGAYDIVEEATEKIQAGE